MSIDKDIDKDVVVDSFVADIPEQELHNGNIGSLGRIHQDTFQSFVASHLAASINMPPFMKIRLICEAALAMPWSKNTEKSLVFQEKVKILNSQNLALENFFTWISEGLKVYTVRWSKNVLDSEIKYKKYFEPWAFEPEAHDILIRNDKKGVQFEKLSSNERFIVRTKYLTLNGLYSLRSLFISYAIPEAMNIMHKTSLYIDPSVLSIPKVSEFR